MGDQQDIQFPAKTVINSFLMTERELSDVIDVVPFCPEHESVWSPALATVVIDAGSQLDSLWRGACRADSPDGVNGKPIDELTIKEYYGHYTKDLAKMWAVFWGHEAARLQPFQLWEGLQEYQPLKWWQDYNAIKHDRLANRKLATLKCAADAVTALFLAIVCCKHCVNEMIASGWMPGSEQFGEPTSLFYENEPHRKSFVIESKLCSCPFAWCGENIKKDQNWYGHGSPRFRQWFNDYCSENEV